MSTILHKVNYLRCKPAENGSVYPRCSSLLQMKVRFSHTLCGTNTCVRFTHSVGQNLNPMSSFDTEKPAPTSRVAFSQMLSSKRLHTHTLIHAYVQWQTGTLSNGAAQTHMSTALKFHLGSEGYQRNCNVISFRE